jgi:hypothetical protein
MEAKAVKLKPTSSATTFSPDTEAEKASREDSSRPAYPVCGGRLMEIHGKLRCLHCHAIVETCCD